MNEGGSQSNTLEENPEEEEEESVNLIKSYLNNIKGNNEAIVQVNLNDKFNYITIQ